MTRRIIAVALLLGLTVNAGAVTKKPVMGGACANWGAALAPLLQCVKIGPARYMWAQVKLTENGPPPLTDTAPKAPPAPVPIVVTATASVVPVSLTAPVAAAPATLASARTAPATTPVPAKFTGRGTSVIGPLKGTTALRVSMVHDGTSNVIVTPFKLNGRDGGLANEIGPFTGTQSYRATGVFYIRIIADGNWSIDMQPL